MTNILQRGSAALLVAAFALCTTAFGQSTGGSVTITVLDQAGATVAGANLELKSEETNDTRRATSQAHGEYTFPQLQFGNYKLTVAAAGFQTAVFESVQVQTGRDTNLSATLKIGGTTEKVEVTANATPLVEADSSTLSDTIDTKQVVNLPVAGRSVMALAFLVPGWSSTGANSTSGTWNNMPGGAVVGADFDGTPGISNRFRSGGFNYGTTAVQPRIEDVGEMTVQTAQLDLSGTGTSAMRIAIVTRHGTNQYHGRLYEDFRNTDLNANSWINNARNLPRNIIKLNDFGGSIGGPIVRNKLFFFGTWAQSLQPGSAVSTANVLSASAQQGLFTYKATNGTLQTLNVLQVGAAAGGASTVLPSAAAQLQKINGVLSMGTLTPTSDPNINVLNFQTTSNITTYYPTIRADYVASQNVRLNVSYSQTKRTSDHVYAPLYPGGIDPLDYTSSAGNNRIAGFGVDWTIRPTMINQFHAGYMYQYSAFDPENLGINLPAISQLNWGYGTSLYQSSVYPRLPISSFYPLLTANDSLNWQRGNHSIVIGGSFYREQDHYWNGPGGFPQYAFGITGQDPLGAAFTSALANASTTNLTNAENLYSELTGRVSSVNISVGRPLNPATRQYQNYGAYNLDEVQAAAGFWIQDRWRLRPNVTLNYGLRWDFIGDDHDVNGGYSTLPTLGDLWGPTPVGKIFSPGTLGGVQNPNFVAQVHAYNPSYVEPSPAVALAWSPLGGDKTVVRLGYSLRHYTEGAQNFWAFASNSGQFFFQSGSLTSNPTPALGNFTPGSLTFGDPLPAYFLSPSTYSTTTPAANLFPGTFYGMNRNIGQPYVEQWNFGIQRQLGGGSAFEARYVGNLSLHQWLAYNINEVNIIENGFLKEFQNAQSNLKINQAAGKGNTFANLGLPGNAALPIFTAAFGGAASSNFTNGTYITNLTNGAAGTLATTLAGNTTFYCNLVGTAAFPACASKVGTVAGAGYPVNFWQVNPYSAGRSVNYLDSAGSSNYHALQLEFRQRLTHGAQFNVNYTWSHSLGISAQNGIQGQGNNIYYTDRNFHLNYGPGLFDIRQVVHASGTYDLPFGKGKAFLNYGGIADRVFGGWTLGTILVIQSGTPVQVTNGFATLNGNDSGVVFNNYTAAQLQQQVGVYHSGNPWVSSVNPALLAANGIANSAQLTPENTAGVLGYRPYIYGPHWFNDDFSLNKNIAVREGIHLTFQAEFLNLFNHPTFNLTNLAIQSLTFAQSTGGPTSARQIELRANLVF